MDYKAVGIGPDDLRLDVGELLSEIAAPDGTPLVCANLSIYGERSSGGAKVVQAGKYRIGITAVLGKQAQKGIKADEIVFSDPAKAIVEARAKFQRENCNLLVLLCYGSTEESLEIAISWREGHYGYPSEARLQNFIKPFHPSIRVIRTTDEIDAAFDNVVSYVPTNFVFDNKGNHLWGDGNPRRIEAHQLKDILKQAKS